MIRYNRVSPRYWVVAKEWDDRTRVVGIYVLTCRHRVSEGLFSLPKAYIADDLAYTVTQVAKALGTIVSAGVIKYDGDAEVVLIPDALEIQAPSTGKQIQGAISRLRMVPATPLLCDLHSHANAHANGFAEAIRMAFPMVVRVNGRVHSNDRTQAHARSSTTGGEQA